LRPYYWHIISFVVITTFSMSIFFFFTAPAPTAIYTLSLHDALPISFHGEEILRGIGNAVERAAIMAALDIPFGGFGLLERDFRRSEEHTSELQSQSNIVCRLLLEKKKLQAI